MSEFFESPDKITQWQAFIRRNRIDSGGAGLAQVVAELIIFLLPPLQAAANDLSFSAIWERGGPWVMA